MYYKVKESLNGFSLSLFLIFLRLYWYMITPENPKLIIFVIIPLRSEKLLLYMINLTDLQDENLKAVINVALSVTHSSREIWGQLKTSLARNFKTSVFLMFLLFTVLFNKFFLK